MALGKQLQDDVRRRKGSSISVTVDVKHVERGADGWARAETVNFRLYHSQSRERAEQIVRAAENARAAAILKWAGESKGAWSPVCDLYLHPSAADYARATGKNDTTPGHATYQLQGGAVVKRRLDLRADEPNLLTSTLPHETTHLVLGELFADGALPRWADEGMAVLAEPRSQFEHFVRTLHRCRAQGELVHLGQLMQRSDYPPAAAITAFYVQSVSIVDFLVGERRRQDVRPIRSRLPARQHRFCVAEKLPVSERHRIGSALAAQAVPGRNHARIVEPLTCCRPRAISLASHHLPSPVSAGVARVCHASIEQ